MAPLVSWALRIAGRGGKISDNFNRTTSGNLGSTSTGGVEWSIYTGAWQTNGSRPTTTTSGTSDPLAVITHPVDKVDLSLTLGAGDALYFRVQDASNWWRALWEGYQTSSCQQCCSSCCSTCCNTCTGQCAQCCAPGGTPCNCSCCNLSGVSCNGCGCGCTGYYAGCYACGQCSSSCNCYSCNCYSCNCTSCNCVYYDNYRLLLQKKVSGTGLTTVQTGSVLQGSANATTRARVVLSGTNTITAFHGSTQLYTGAQSDLAGTTRYGIGRGTSSYDASAMDDFELTW